MNTNERKNSLIKELIRLIDCEYCVFIHENCGTSNGKVCPFIVEAERLGINWREE